MPSAYHPDLGEIVQYDWQALPEDADGQVRETIAQMRRYIRQDVSNPLIVVTAEKAIEMGDGDPVAGVWRLLKSRMRFKHDEEIAQDLNADDARKSQTIEVLIRPVDQARAIILTGRGTEDCDGFNMFAACLLASMGVPVSLVTVAADPDRPQEYSHVYTAAYPNGRKNPRVALDFSHGPEPGWECCPRARTKEWPVELTIGEILWNALFPVSLFTASYFGVRYLERKRAAAA